ncbi:MAG: glycosyltransferase [Candidatus Omnitrophica bacterium]|nr:glycosyltransferase [Candidatus Omnitrophota bacterium]
MPEKNILILYATAGAGHRKAAEAILRAAKNNNLEAETADVVAFMPAIFAKIYSDGYIFLIKYLGGLWGFLYFLSDTRFFSLINVHLRKFADRFACRKLITYLLKKQPDVIISTHFLTSEAAAYAKLKYGLKSRLITVITDFGVHNFWICPGTDIYCCASDATRDILIAKGIAPENIRITGIPLDGKFLNAGEKETLLGEFGLNKDRFTALIMTGGIGAGPIEEIVELLKDDVQLLVICGFNKDLYNRLSSKKYPNVRVFGFIDYVQKLMKASQVIVTKAGGLSVSESLATGLPMIFFFLIPGQETLNARTIESQQAGFIARDPKDIKDIILGLKNDPAALTALKNKGLSLAKPNSAQDIIALAN